MALPMAAVRVQFRALHHAGRFGTALVALMGDSRVGADCGEGGRCQETLRLRVA